MPTTIYVEIPDMILERYTSPTELERSIYEDIIISEFQKGHLTIRESAKLLDLTYEGFMELLGERNLSFINASQDELKQSYEDFERFLQTSHQ
jgi:predicted HTH domain antitoxin